MPVDQPPRIFISYSTKDGNEAAAALRCELEGRRFSIWQDIVALKGSADWWSQIEHALRSKGLQHFVLVVTPGALASRYVRDEIRLARQEGKTVSPVRGPGIGDMADLPRWLGNLYDLDIPERKTVFLNALAQSSTAARVPMTAPEPPEDFVARPNSSASAGRCCASGWPRGWACRRCGCPGSTHDTLREYLIPAIQ